MKKKILSSITVAIIAAGLAYEANADWASTNSGYVPSGSFISGHESDGEALYACRSNYRGGLHPGKVRSEFGACNISWGGREIPRSGYETYVPSHEATLLWQEARDGEVPSSAMVAGHEVDGSKLLYICRGDFEGGVHSGKIGSDYRACNIGWGGLEVKVNPYEVLIQ